MSYLLKQKKPTPLSRARLTKILFKLLENSDQNYQLSGSQLPGVHCVALLKGHHRWLIVKGRTLTRSFWSELKRRKVTRAAITYVLSAWVLLQLGDIVIEPLGWPAWFQTALIIGLAIGFPIVVTLAWVYELTSSGLAREREVGIETLNPETGSISLTIAKPCVAVLAFEESGEEVSQHLGDGIAEEILNTLAPYKSLKVIARTSSFRFSSKELDMAAIREQLGVSHLITGSLRRAGDRIRVSVQLVDAATESQLWANAIHRGKHDIFELQSDVASVVGAELLEIFGLTPIENLRNWELAPKAFEQYLMASAAFRRGDYPKALQYAAKSEDIDPENPLVPALISEVYLNWPRYGFAVTQEELTLARKHSRRAVAIDNNYLPAKAGLGMLALYMGRDFAAAFDAVVDAAIRQPGLVDWLPVLLTYANRYEEAIEVQSRIAQRDPLNTVNLLTWANRLNWIGEVDKALDVCERARELDPHHMVLSNNDYRWSIRDGNYERARGLLKAWGLNPEKPADRSKHSWLPNSLGLWMGARLYGELGELETAHNLARAIENEEGFTPTTVAEAYICAGAIDDAYRIWDLGIRRLDSGIYDLARPENMRDPDNYFWLAFRNDPRFDEHCVRLGIDEDSLVGIDWHKVNQVLS